MSGHRRLLLLLAAALLGRALLCFWLVPAWEVAQRRSPQPDHYPSLARTLLAERTLGYQPADGASPTTVRGPGFPVWLCAGLLIADSGRWLAFWGGLPMLAVAFAGALAAGRRLDGRAELVVFSLLAFHPLAAFNSARGMADEFVAALGFGAFLLFDHALTAGGGRRSWAGFVGAGLLLDLQILTRVTGLFFLLPLLAAGWFGRERRRRAALMVGAIALAGPALWSIRSSRLEGRPVFVQSLTAYNFWLGEAHDRFGSAWTSSENHRRFMDLIGDRGGIPPQKRARFSYSSLTPRENAALEAGLGAAAIASITADPIHHAARFLRGLGLFWVLGQTPRRTLQYALVVVPLLALAAAGAWRSRRSPAGLDRMAGLCLIAIVLNNVAYAAILPMARFGIHLYPQLAWLAALAFQRRVETGSAADSHPRA